ncbi:MAG: SDR family oxidoreductase [Deltaproteobacteria bacterium]|nr:SDR family oxidoreductase [Deltaproteobacteria bacterium]
MDLGLQGKVAIVTGSSDGIGFAIAHALAQEGARVVLCARREALLAEARDAIAKEPGAELLAVPCDVQQLPDVQRLVTETMQRFGAIHILVNNAGSVPSIQFTAVDDASWHRILEGKLLNYIRVTREVVPYMQKAGWGRIISIAGTAGWQPSNTAMAAGLNNAAVINWTKSMSLQYAADGILVTAVAPGSIETPRQIRNRQRQADIRGVSRNELLKAREREIPLQRLGLPEEIASVVVFLASKQSSYMTGSCVTVDGGVTRGI